MIVNLEEDELKTYELSKVDYMKIRELLVKIGCSTKPEHLIHLGDYLEASSADNIDGDEFYLYGNVTLTETVKRGWTNDFYNDHSYTEYIREYDKYKVPQLYTMLALTIHRYNDQKFREEACFEVLSKISRLCDLKRFNGKKVFDIYKEEIIKAFYVEQIENSKRTNDIYELYQLLYVENNKQEIFPKSEFCKKYRIKTHNLKNIPII